jgi:hypothetical protein
MNKKAFADFSCCLQYRSPGNAPPWDDGCAVYYFASLSEIPDADAPILMKAVMTGGCGKFRPDPDEVLALWRKITKPTPVAAEEMAGMLLLKRREKGLYQRKIPNDPCCRWETTEPPWGDHQKIERRVSAGMGGWTAFCEDNSPMGVLRAQIIKLTAAIMSGADDTTVGMLRLEYLAANPPALVDTASEVNQLPEAVASYETRQDGPYETRQTATELWANIGASVNLRKTRLEMVGGEKEVTA